MPNTVDNLSLLLQMISLEILFKDYNNSDLMQELQKQDTEYFEKIIENQEKILKILNERSNYETRNNN
jgi:hypothetical protein